MIVHTALMRSLGAPMLMAATACPLASKTGAAMPFTLSFHSP